MEGKGLCDISTCLTLRSVEQDPAAGGQEAPSGICWLEPSFASRTDIIRRSNAHSSELLHVCKADRQHQEIEPHPPCSGVDHCKPATNICRSRNRSQIIKMLVPRPGKLGFDQIHLGGGGGRGRSSLYKRD